MVKKQESILEKLIYEITLDALGIYPASINDKKRTEWQDGWNACVTDIHEKIRELEDKMETIPKVVKNYIITKKIRIYFCKEGFSFYVLCNDLFYWGCSDGEDFEVSDLPEFQKALKESPKNGELLWVCRKRKMRPQKPYYKCFSEKEVELFNSCGKERKE